MAIDFNGETLTVTLDSGVTEVDVVNDLYAQWKEWLLADPNNRKYPQTFSSDGGNPLTSIINQGSYIFLQNQLGWRIKPPEEDITVFLTGNLAVSDISLGSILPTTGAFTAAILGLQPITQGVTPAMADQLAYTSFQGVVCIDQTGGVAGTGSVGSDKVGTRRAPSNNTDDALIIAMRERLTTFIIVSDLTTTLSTDFSAGYQFKGDSLFTQVTLGAGLNLLNCSFSNMTLNGEMDGVNTIQACEVEDITAASGDIHGCDLEGDISVVGPIHIIDSYSGRAALGYPRLINTAAHEIVIRNYKGSIGVAGMTGGSHSIGVYGGRLIVEASCSGGTIYVRGEPYEITDLAAGAVTIVDQTNTGGLSAQETRDAMKLSPTAGVPDAGSIDEHLDNQVDPWSVVLPGAYTQGQAGHILGWQEIINGTVTGGGSTLGFTDTARIGAGLFYWDRVMVQFTTGLNAGLMREIYSYETTTGVFFFKPSLPDTIATGTEYRFLPHSDMVNVNKTGGVNVATWNSTSVSNTLGYPNVNVLSVSGDFTTADNMQIVFSTDFATNYNTTRNAWATNVEDTVGIGSFDTATGFATSAALTTIDGKVDTIDGIVDAILVDTGTSIPAQNVDILADIAAIPSTDISSLETKIEADARQAILVATNDDIQAKALEMWQRLGLDASNPLVTNEDGSLTVGTITVGAVTTGVTPNRQTTQTRVP